MTTDFFNDRRNKTTKDILMICKGHYSDKYNSTEDALLAYYNLYYWNDAQGLTYKEIVNIWFIDCIFAFVSPENLQGFLNKVFNQTCVEEWIILGINKEGKRPATDFYEVLYYRLKAWMDDLQIRDDNGNWLIDLSDYLDENNNIIDVI